MLIIQVGTWYTNNPNESNSIINLMFFWVNSEEIDTYSILPDLWSSSDHAPLTVNIIISKKFIQDKQWTIIKNSVEEKGFINEIKKIVGNIDVTNIPDSKSLEKEFMAISENIWNKYSKYVKTTKNSKAWWNKECSRKLNTYYSSKSSLDWKIFKGTVKRTKRLFFDVKFKKSYQETRDLGILWTGLINANC